MRANINRLWLFVRIVWRQWEGPESGIPDPYRAKYRLDWRLAWEIAKTVHP